MAEDDFWSEMGPVVQQGIMAKCDADGEHRAFVEADFVRHRHQSLAALRAVLQRSDELAPVQSNTNLRIGIVPVLMLCSENVTPGTLWTTDAHIVAAYQILSALKKRVFHSESVSDILLNSHNGNVIKYVLAELRARLLIPEWKRFPAVCVSMEWFLHQICFPQMSLHLAEFLPFSLRLTDDWNPQLKTAGLRCLRHVIHECVASEIRWFGRDAVIKDVLFHMISVREEPVAQLLFPTLMEFLDKIVGPKKIGQFDWYDQTVQKLLFQLTMESDTHLKRIYMKQLPGLLQRLDIGLVRWMQSVLKVLAMYLTYPDVEQREQLRVDALSALQLVIKQCPDVRLSAHAKDVLEMLLRLCYEVSGKEDDASMHLSSFCQNILVQLAVKCPDRWVYLCHDLDQVSINGVFDETVRQVFHQVASALSPSCHSTV